MENFSITATAVHGRLNNSSNNSKDKYCHHCNRAGHTKENYRPIKFYCKYCDKKGYIEDRCKYKDKTWVFNNTQTQNFFFAVNATDFSQFTYEGYLGDTSTPAYISNSTDSSNNSSKSLHGLSIEQLQQLAHAISMINQNHASDNSNVYANVAGLSTFFNASANFVFTKPWILDSGAIDHIIYDSTFLLNQNIHQYLLLIYLSGPQRQSLQQAVYHSIFS